jgi:hypothetical protein
VASNTEPRQPTQADDLWTGLDLRSNDQVTEAILIGKIADFETGGTALSLAATDGTDWVTQFGIITGALNIMRQSQFAHRDED